VKELDFHFFIFLWFFFIFSLFSMDLLFFLKPNFQKVKMNGFIKEMHGKMKKQSRCALLNHKVFPLLVPPTSFVR